MIMISNFYWHKSEKKNTTKYKTLAINKIVISLKATIGIRESDVIIQKI